MTTHEENRAARWATALKRAALPGASRVLYRRETKIEDGVPTTAHRLTSFDAKGAAIGDDRDYDLLKAVMMPLEALAEAEPADPLEVTFIVGSGEVAFGLDD